MSADPTSRSKDRLRAAAPFGWLAAASILFRLPALLNARGVHSDAAIVGLQAMHMLDGEWSRFLWGAGYQGSLDALLIALAFALTGRSAQTLMWVPLAGHLLLTWFAFSTLQRRLGTWCAAISTLPLVFAPQAINGVALYAPRQWSIAFVFCGLWLLDGASESRRATLKYAAGVAIGVFSLYLDLFALQFMVGLLFFAVACTLDGNAPTPALRRRLAAILLGLALGLLLVWLLRRGSGASVARLSMASLPTNFNLLWETCLPWLLGYKVFRPEPWEPPRLFHAIQVLGAALSMLGVVAATVLVFWRRIPWELRRCGLFGALCTASSLGGFLLSNLPSDLGAVRYLAPIVWTLPFSLATAAHLLGRRLLAIGLAPYLVAAAVGGWLSFGPYVRGPLPALDARGVAAEEMRLAEKLRQRGIKYAAAGYWLSYRLTFLFGEDPVVIPLNPTEDRYPPYRAAFNAAPDVALIFHPSEPGTTAELHEVLLRQTGKQYERLNVAGFTVLIHHRT